jgi:hypothetical protein
MGAVLFIVAFIIRLTNSVQVGSILVVPRIVVMPYRCSSIYATVSVRLRDQKKAIKA